MKLFRKKNALVMGLGLHGGGVASVKWLLSQGAKVSVTDMKEKEALAPSLGLLRGHPVRYVLGRHEKADFLTPDFIVLNPGVPRSSPYLALAIKHGIAVENDASLFFRYTKNPIIAVTGTRGKTTTTYWVAALLRKRHKGVLPSGNIPENPFLKEWGRVSKKNIPVVAECSSWQLELLPRAKHAPHIAVITNLYPDHLNRYKDIRDYANAKANIFAGQKKSDVRILNRDNAWWKHFAKKPHIGKTYYVSTKPLPPKTEGMFVRKGVAILRIGKTETSIVSIVRFTKERGVHNLENLLSALLAAKTFDPKITVSERGILLLPTPMMREEIIMKKGNVTVVNDSCATSPDGTIAAIMRFRTASRIVLIAGGTDKALEFRTLATTIKKYMSPGRLVLLEGSATAMLVSALRKSGYVPPRPLQDLDACVRTARRALAGGGVLLFSPGAASFEKFLHEFDRVRKFTSAIKKQFS